MLQFENHIIFFISLNDSTIYNNVLTQLHNSKEVIAHSIELTDINPLYYY